MVENREIDEKDLEILRILQRNARKPFLEIARQLGISGATVHERVNRMLDARIIEGFASRLNPKKLGYGVSAMIGVTLDHPVANVKEFNKELKAIPEVEEAHNVTGDIDMIIKVRAKSIDELRELIVKRIQFLPGVRRLNTSIILDSPVERTELPL